LKFYGINSMNKDNNVDRININNKFMTLYEFVVEIDTAIMY